MPSNKFNQLTATEIKAKLNSHPIGEPINHFPLAILEGPPRIAAILMLFIWIEEEWHLLYIRRTEIEGDRHSGQVAFPGGGKESQDATIEASALREANEELGIESNDVQLLGRLNDFITISNFRVTPIIGVLPWPYEFTLSPLEVSRAFTIPLSWLADENNREELSRELPTGESISVIYFKEYNQEILWGASARFTVELLNVLS